MGALEFAKASPKKSKGAKSETVTCNKLSLPWLGDTGNGKFVCIDTPGLNDSEGRDDMLINDIVGSMKEVEYVTAVVIVVNSSEARFNKALQDVLHRFEEAFCGPAEDPEDPTRPDPEYEKRCNFFYENILVVFQRWKMNEDAAADREDDGITEESVTKDFNCQLRAKFPYCNKDVPCVFVDSHDRKPERKNPTLLRVRDLVPPDVFLSNPSTKSSQGSKTTMERTKLLRTVRRSCRCARFSSIRRLRLMSGPFTLPPPKDLKLGPADLSLAFPKPGPPVLRTRSKRRVKAVRSPRSLN